MGNVTESLSARRAWIEIKRDIPLLVTMETSLSARRAWIEILVGDDGNEVNQGRSPQGERG